ncbi:MAG: hypothetical protein WC554_15765, partial [Clostridia bacterium]
SRIDNLSISDFKEIAIVLSRLDNISIADNTSENLISYPSIVDGINLGEELDSLEGMYLQITDTVKIGESINYYFSYFLSIIDNLILSDSLSETTTPTTTSIEAYNVAIDADVRQWQLSFDIYFDGDGSPPTTFTEAELVGWELLEETYAEGNNPLGAASANEFTFILDNSERLFTATNTESPYYGKLLPNLLVHAYAWLITDSIGNYYPVDLGEYRTNDWSSPSNSLETTVICHDDVYEYSQIQTPQMPAMQTVNLQTMWANLLKGLNLTATDFIIDEFTQAIKIGWFNNDMALENFQLLAERGLGAVYGNRNSQIRVKAFTNLPDPLYFWTDSNQIIVADLPQDYYNTYSQVIVKYYQPYVGETETLLSNSYTVPVGGTTIERLQVDSGPVGIYEGVNILGASDVTLGTVSLGMWDGTLQLNNTGQEETVTIEIIGRKIEYIQSTVTVEDTDLKALIGTVTLEIDNHLIQSKEAAESYAAYVLQLVIDPSAYAEISARGNPNIKLTDTMNITYTNGKISNLNIIPTRILHSFRGGLSAQINAIKKSVRELS